MFIPKRLASCLDLVKTLLLPLNPPVTPERVLQSASSILVPEEQPGRGQGETSPVLAAAGAAQPSLGPELDGGCCIHFHLLKASWERVAGLERGSPGETVARGQRENRAAGPCQRMACPTSHQYASADTGQPTLAKAQVRKAEACLFCLMEKKKRGNSFKDSGYREGNNLFIH